MARTTYRTRLQDLLAKDFVGARDRQFITSLLATYNQKGYLSRNRAHWVRKLEARYEKEPTVDATVATRISNLRSLMARIPKTETWEADFTKSVISQLLLGRLLSDKQNEVLKRIESDYSPAGLQAKSDWASRYAASAAMREEFAIMVRYYKRGSYYSALVARAEDRSYVPTAKEFRLLTENKYAVKILKGYHAPPKFAAGTMVAVRTNYPTSHTSRQASVKAGTMALIIKANITAPTSACAGNKVYRVLPIGGRAPFDIEERWIKKAPKGKK